MFIFELKKSLWVLKRKRLGYLLGTLFLIAAFYGLRQASFFGFLSSKYAQHNALFVFLGWSLILGTTLEVCTNLCHDINYGVFQKLVQSPRGLNSILTARFLSSAVLSVVSALIIMMFVYFIDGKTPSPSLDLLVLFVIIFAQSYAATIFLAAVTISQKTVTSAQVISLVFLAPLIFLPIERVFSDKVAFVPLAGPLTAIKSAPGFVSMKTLLVISILMIIASTWAFEKIVTNLKRNGTLLFV